MTKITLERTKKGLPAFWERGGGCTNTGSSYIIADSRGNKKKAIYIRRKGTLSNSLHALVIVEPGDYIIQAYHHRGDFEIQVHRVGMLVPNSEAQTWEAVIQETYSFSENEWDKEPPEFLRPAIEAAKEKALTYHCRRPFYVEPPDN